MLLDELSWRLLLSQQHSEVPASHAGIRLLLQYQSTLLSLLFIHLRTFARTVTSFYRLDSLVPEILKTPIQDL
jgi:hypothetical protein